MKLQILLAVLGAIAVFAILKIAGLILKFALVAALAGLVAGYLLGRMLDRGKTGG